MTVKITIDGDGLHYDMETTIVKASQVIAFLGSEQQIANDINNSSQRPLIVNSILERPKASPREAIDESKARTIPQKIAVLGKYLTDRDGVQTFTAVGIREALKNSGESIPANLNRDFKEAVRSNFICEDGDGEFYVTQNGHNSIRDQFSSGGTKSLKPKKRSKAKGRKIGVPTVMSEKVSNLNITDKFAGMPDYWNLKDGKAQRIMWLLMYAKKHEIDSLTFKEIAYLASKLNDDIQTGAITALLSKAVKSNQVATVSGGYRIIKGGMDFIQKLSEGIQE